MPANTPLDRSWSHQAASRFVTRLHSVCLNIMRTATCTAHSFTTWIMTEPNEADDLSSANMRLVTAPAVVAPLLHYGAPPTTIHRFDDQDATSINNRLFWKHYQ
jgi:hypothetical protein